MLLTDFNYVSLGQSLGIAPNLSVFTFSIKQVSFCYIRKFLIHLFTLPMHKCVLLKNRYSEWSLIKISIVYSLVLMVIIPAGYTFNESY